MAEILAALKKQRSTNKAKLTNLVKYAKENHTDTDLGELTTRLRRVEQLMEEFTQLELKIFTANPNEESDLAYEENYYTAVTALNACIRSKNLDQGVISLDMSHNTSQQNGDQVQVKLPKIHIQSFSGDYSEWQSFYDMFTTTIHESPNLNPVQKFQYLKGLLRGEAALLLRHMAVTESNYIGALSKLKERYDRKKHIINTFIRTFIDQPIIHNSSAANIKRLMDTSDEVIRGLQALGEIAETRDPWLIYLLMQKLDDKSKSLWAEYSADIINPPFSDFLKFLSRRIDTLESVTTTSKRSGLRSEIKSHLLSHESDHAVEGHFALKTPIKSQCTMCQDNKHAIFQCSKFHSMDVTARKEFIKEKKKCLNCLSGNHPLFRCPSRRRCLKCGKKHNTLLHSEEPSDTNSSNLNIPSRPSENTQSMHVQNTTFSAILPTAIIAAVNSFGETIPCRALLDSGSQASFVTESCVQRLQLKKRNARISISGLGQSGAGVSKGLVTISIKPKLVPAFSINALVMPKITSKLPVQNIQINLQRYNDVILADPQFNKSSNIDILIGADHFFDLLEDGQIKGGVNEPTLQNTVFGWVVSGPLSDTKCEEVECMLSVPDSESDVVNIDQSLRNFWEIESITDQKILSPEETFCEHHFRANTQRDAAGRFIVKYPFKHSPNKLGESLPSAIQRLRSVERRFIRNPLYAKLYKDFMLEYQQLNHMVEIDPKETSANEFYLPHHGVLKPSSSTSKMRVVFDGSAKTTTKWSLNDCLATGPTVQSNLYSIILRFRENKIAFSADIEKMYRQVSVSPEDTQYQKIVWRTDPSQQIRHYRLTTVTYGLASASFLATRTLNQAAEDNQISLPDASNVITRDTYVDDLMTGADDENKATQLRNEVTAVLQSYGFNLRKWKSNSNVLLSSIPLEHQETSGKEIEDHAKGLNESVKILGIQWNPDTDSFIFTSKLTDATNFTKRTILSEASRLFDPLGWLSPIVITFKIFLQGLWAENLNWDDIIPRERIIQWEKLRNNLKTINQISIPRFLQTTNNATVDVHGFCDASQLAYAAVVFFRIQTTNGRTIVQLVTSKTKVAPIKVQTLPRLELCGALLLARLIKVVKKESTLKINEIYAWTDSEIVLDWLGSHPSHWSTFVGNRTSEIISELPRSNWKHVPSPDNPADCASRGLSPSELKGHLIWWHGPNWLRETSTSWPPQRKNYSHSDEKSKHSIRFTFTSIISNQCYDELISKFSSFLRLQRVLAYILRFIGNAIKPKSDRIVGVYLRREELSHVVNIISRYEQRKIYSEEVLSLQGNGVISKSSSLKSLDPFIDDNGLLRVGGRLQNSIAPYSTKHPIILPPTSTITLLILRDIHLFNKHAGPTLLLSIARQEYWIPNGKYKAKEVVRKCVTCSKFKSQCQQQLMGSLPSSRVELIRPFLKTGVDYAGPIFHHIRKGRGQKTYKAYLCLFVCLSTKAVHLELVGDLSSESFLGALKRFSARRGVCLELHSDNGTNFVGADRKLREDFAKLIKDSNNISAYLSRNRITWHFIPPSSPHFGGLWEAAIKSAKYHMKRVIGKNILTIEELNTLLAEIEGILNSRPICVINDTEVDPLTPAHFLIGHPITKIPELNISHLKPSHLTRWQMVTQITQHFWQRWYLEYLTSLQHRSKWRTRKPDIHLNDVVLIIENNLPTNQWLLGKVIKLHPGPDGQTRVVTVKTQNHEMKRPINKLCILPVSPEN